MDLGKDIKGVIFDLDGTLFNLSLDWEGLREQIQACLGVERMSFDAMLELATKSNNNDVRKLIDNAEVSGVVHGQPTKNARGALRTLSKQYIVWVVTRNCRAAAERALQQLDAAHVQIIGREDVERLKPHPEAISMALIKMGLGVHEVVMVGDTTHDVEAARALGMFVVVVRNSALAYIPKEANVYIDTLDRLPAILNEQKEV